MEKISLLVNTQTPLVQFLDKGPHSGPWPAEVDLGNLKEGADYRFSPGGVTRMVYPLLQRLLARGVVRSAHWVSLNPNAPATVRVPGITLHNVAIDPERVSGYGKAKEAIWATAHGLAGPGGASGLFWTDDFAEYTYYNRTCSETIRALDREHDFDLFYIHDFQQLAVGHMLTTLKPKVFRWHIPFAVEQIPAAWRVPFQQYLSAYDLVIVSTEGYRQALKRFGHQGEVALVYPYVDPGEYARPARAKVSAVAKKYGVDGDVRVALVVGRMDPTKGQDRAITALAELKRTFPDLRLVLVGNGSFSGTSSGLGLSKGAVWKDHLVGTAADLGVSDRVVLTGHVSQEELDCLYDLCEFTILPSVNEGFGLVVVESWLHRRPAVVTERAGISELIESGKNGILFDPDQPGSLAKEMSRLLRDPGELRRRLVERGRSTARRCSVDVAVETETELLGRMVEA